MAKGLGETALIIKPRMAHTVTRSRERAVTFQVQGLRAAISSIASQAASSASRIEAWRFL